VNKFTAYKVISYNGKMSTNNMTKLKWLKYSCIRICNVDAQIIDWIVDLSMNTAKREKNNTAPRKMTNNTTSHLGDEITKKKPRSMWKSHI